MRNWRVREFGAFTDTLDLCEVPPPLPNPGAALVRVRAAGVNFPDLLVIGGKYQVRPELPFTPGFEAAGEIVEPGSTGFAPGQRVLCWAESGAFTEYLCAPREHLFRVPPSMPDAEAAAFLVTYQTMYFALVRRANLQRGQTLLVHGGAGALGSGAIQLGKAFGATVIATTNGVAKTALCLRLGADHAIDRSTSDFVDAVRELTNGRGADVIVDPVGGTVFDRSLRCIAFEGCILPLGFTSGEIPTVPVNRILLKNISVSGVYWGAYWMQDRPRIHAVQEQLNALYEQGKVRPLVGKTFGMTELPDALRALLNRANYGKHVVLMEPA